MISLLQIVVDLQYRKYMASKIKKRAQQPEPKPKSPMKLEIVFQIWAWILLFWSLYRYFFKLPEWADEFVFKPLIFVAPVIWYVFQKERRGWSSLGITGRNIFNNIYIGIGLGFLFAFSGVASNWFKNGRLVINPIQAFRDYGMISLLGISLATALCEEILSRGFLFKRIYEISKNMAYSAVISSGLFVMLHIPILVTSLKFQGPVLIIYFCTNILIGIINSLLLANTGSLIAPILVHIFWNMTVALYL
jgi:membrane protease YdiL (CAAX protease family)